MSGPDSTRAGIAITGMACRYPRAGGLDALWQRLCDPAAHAAQARHLGPPRAGYAEFGIPPIYRNSINQVQLDLLDLAREALGQAGLDEDAIDRERTDVIFCSALGMNRQYENHARIAAVAWAEACWPLAGTGIAASRQAWKRKLDTVFRATSHDKVGEMASTMPARVAAHFRLRGRALALESQELGGIEALLAAMDAIALGQAQTVLLLGAQCLASPLAEAVLRERLPASLMAALSEGACALVLQDGRGASGHAIARIERVELEPMAGPRQQPAAAAQDTEHCFYVLDGIGEGGPGGSIRPHASLQAHKACGYGYAMQALSALIQAALLQQRGCPPAAGAPGTVRTTVLGAGLDGTRYRIALAEAGSHAGAGRPVQAAAPIAVLALGACFGDGRDSKDYWEALHAPGHRFRALPHERFGRAAYHDPDPQAPISYYAAQASFSELAQGDAALPLRAPAFDLAHSAACEAFSMLPDNIAGLAGPLLVVTASNLTLAPEKQLAARYLLPRIVAALEELARELGLPDDAAQRAAAQLQARALQEPAPCIDGQTWHQLCASGISRELARALGAEARHVAVEAACAGSLAALELAINSLRSGRCRLAVVAGVEAPVNIADLVLCASQRMLAPGVIASFTRDATGFTPGDGAGVVVLCARADAERWGLPAMAVIRAIAASTQSKSIVAPNPPGQIASMQRAFAQVEFAPGAVDFVETHGTGTVIGDEVEIASLAAVYAGQDRTLRLGALKSRFGHCFAAAGMASLIKTILALQKQALPANHFAAPIKPELALAGHNFDPLEHASPWPGGGPRIRRAAVNAFGTGGINYHLLLEESGD
ncbi:polyketide synthase [Cupriavidus basilensis]|uniref:polyketide synthase n=1 Tax=Cupriavidus basilensis TaxID=68895 RepID=UPI0020A6B7DC|nr:polyketide synthase [Cupriavidus basilensis]MCP3018390.1 hypothetical protein [Cupriavidus basilensis]